LTPLSFPLRSARRWTRCTAPCACWPPAPRGCRWSAARQRPRSPGAPRWTTSSSPSRSSSAPTTSPRPPSNWSPSRPGRRNSDPTDGEGSGGERGGTDDYAWAGPRGVGGASNIGEGDLSTLKVLKGGRGGGGGWKGPMRKEEVGNRQGKKEPDERKRKLIV